MNKNNIPPTRRRRQLIRLRKAEAVMLKMTWKYHNGLCTIDALDKADLDYLEARTQI